MSVSNQPYSSINGMTSNSINSLIEGKSVFGFPLHFALIPIGFVILVPTVILLYIIYKIILDFFEKSGTIMIVSL